jgi:hypothetical protein
MMIMGVDYHPSFQTMAFLMEETGGCGEQELNHSDGQVEKFYRELKQRGVGVLVGMEATGHSRWFERLRAEFQSQLLTIGTIKYRLVLNRAGDKCCPSPHCRKQSQWTV